MKGFFKIMSEIQNAKRIVIKIGSSTLTYSNGKPNYRKIEHIARVVADLQNSGKQVVLVSSGAIAVGVGRLGLKKRPTATRDKQAAAYWSMRFNEPLRPLVCRVRLCTRANFNYTGGY